MENKKNLENDKETLYEEDDEIITLEYDDGQKEDFYNLAELDYKGKWYIYLQPKNYTEEFESDEVIIYEMTMDENDNEVFLPVEDEKLLDILIEELNKSLEE